MHNIAVTLFLKLLSYISEYIVLSHPEGDQSCCQNQRKYHSKEKQEIYHVLNMHNHIKTEYEVEYKPLIQLESQLL